MMRVRGISPRPTRTAARFRRHDRDRQRRAPHRPPRKIQGQPEVDLAYSVAGLGRFRCNAFQQRGTIGMIFRVIPLRRATVDELALPPILKPSPPRNGDSSSSRDHRQRQEHDARSAHRRDQLDAHGAHHDRRGPDRVSAPRQPFDRQPARDRRRYHVVLERAAQRAAPGPRRHPRRRDARFRNNRTALLAAETGHLVFSTLHTLDATETINRIIAVFPPHSRSRFRIQPPAC